MTDEREMWGSVLTAILLAVAAIGVVTILATGAALTDAGPAGASMIEEGPDIATPTSEPKVHPTAQDLLEAAEARWAEFGPDSYVISAFTRTIENPTTPARWARFPLDPASSLVIDGVLADVSSPVDSPHQSSGLTVEQMFATIREALASGQEVRAEYDSEDGHPIGYSIGALDADGRFDYENARGGPRVWAVVPGATFPTCAGKQATIVGSDDRDLIQGSPYADVIVAFGGNDHIYGREGNDTICAGDGHDYVYGDVRQAVLDGIQPPLDSWVDQNDVLIGGLGTDRIHGEGGVDIIEGGGGSDWLYGGDGGDRLTGGSGADRMWGDDGADVMFGQGGQDRMWGGDGDDSMQGNWQSDKLWGGAGNDTMGGAEGKDELYGDAGNDTMYGGNNSDLLSGRAGDDVLSGGPGADELHGGAGTNILGGGPHTDTCYRRTQDTLNSCQIRRSAEPG